MRAYWLVEVSGCTLLRHLVLELVRNPLAGLVALLVDEAIEVCGITGQEFRVRQDVEFVVLEDEVVLDVVVVEARDVLVVGVGGELIVPIE